MNVMGLDPSVSSFGVALPDGSTRVIRPIAGADDNSRRLNEIVFRLDNYLRLHRPDLVVIEGAIPSKFYLSALRLGEIRGAVLIRLFELGIAYVEIPPAQLKQYATGNGNAKKPEMFDAAVASGATPANHDEADAFWLHALGRMKYGSWRPPYKMDELEATRRAIINKLAWPLEVVSRG